MATAAQSTTFKFTPAGGAELTVGKLKSIGDISVEAGMIDVSTLDSVSAYKEYILGMKDGGEVPLVCEHLKTDTGQVGIRTAFSGDKLCACVVTFPDSTTAAFSAYVKSFNMGAAEVDGSIKFNATFKITGAVTITV